MVFFTLPLYVFHFCLCLNTLHFMCYRHKQIILGLEFFPLIKYFLPIIYYSNHIFSCLGLNSTHCTSSLSCLVCLVHYELEVNVDIIMTMLL